MANAEQVALLKAGVEEWNEWREEEPNKEVDLSEADLSGANLRSATLIGANLSKANLSKANLSRANLSGANLSDAILGGADLGDANLRGANLSGAFLREANLREAILNRVNLRRANLSLANLRDANLSRANLSRADLIDADLHGADLSDANLSRANLNYAYLGEANLNKVNLSRASFFEADLIRADLSGADLSGASLFEADLIRADLSGADLSGADLSGADLSGADLRQANINGANLTAANLNYSNLVAVNVEGAILSKGRVYGVSVWDLEGEFQEQKDLVITSYGQPSITVDNIEVAQFIYLILNNKKIRNVLDTLTSKSVLILGRFSDSERKAILDALRNKLREYDLLPIVFDFDRPTDKDFTETIKTLAGMCYFVIADVTNPKSSPLELQAAVPDYQIPFVPIIQEGEKPFAMMVDLQKKYNWVLDTISYDSLDTLLEILKPHIIDPAIRKRDELRLIKAKEPTIISGRELRDKGKL